MKIRNRNKAVYRLIYILSCSILLCSCSVGLNTNITASRLSHPVSFNDTFFYEMPSQADSVEIRIVKSFSFEFSQWGISSPLNMRSNRDISDKLNRIIAENDGDAITDLKISVSNAEINKLAVFVKVVSLWAAIGASSLFLAGESVDNAAVAGSSILVYLLTPAKANIKVEGNVVRLE